MGSSPGRDSSTQIKSTTDCPHQKIVIGLQKNIICSGMPQFFVAERISITAPQLGRINESDVSFTHNDI
jgi:hypothetical protein